MPAFTVTHTNKIASKRRLLVSDRTDLNMSVQRRAARFTSREKLQMALMADYTTTISSRATHHHFLTLMLNEIHQHHQRTFNVVLPFRALEILAERRNAEMTRTDGDHYAEFLAALAQLHLYSREFQKRAAQLVAAAEKKAKADEAMTASTLSANSCGLSDADDHN
jgi:hypothetical protein